MFRLVTARARFVVSGRGDSLSQRTRRTRRPRRWGCQSPPPIPLRATPAASRFPNWCQGTLDPHCHQKDLQVQERQPTMDQRRTVPEGHPDPDDHAQHDQDRQRGHQDLDDVKDAFADARPPLPARYARKVSHRQFQNRRICASSRRTRTAGSPAVSVSAQSAAAPVVAVAGILATRWLQSSFYPTQICPPHAPVRRRWRQRAFRPFVHPPDVPYCARPPATQRPGTR